MGVIWVPGGGRRERREYVVVVVVGSRPQRPSRDGPQSTNDSSFQDSGRSSATLTPNPGGGQAWKVSQSAVWAADGRRL